MRFFPLWPLAFVVCVCASSCSQLTRAKITIIFDHETATRCVKVSAKSGNGSSVAASPSALTRGTADTLTIGLGETNELKGAVQVTVKRFGTDMCTGMELGSETKEVTLAISGAELEFRYSGPLSDGGVDGGVDAGTDAGFDAGCDTSMCSPGECRAGTPACGCVYMNAALGTACDGGICSSNGTCQSNPCAVLAENAPCNIGLMCNTNPTCVGGSCTGGCANTPNECQTLLNNMCATATECATLPRPDGTNCSSGGQKCRGGACVPWVTFPVLNLRVDPATVPYPDAGWVIVSPDGGACDTIISTNGTTPIVERGDCGSPPIVSTIDDAGVAVMLMTSLQVGPAAKLHFVGTRPAQLIVLGSATVTGLISVAPTTSSAPAGMQPTACSMVPDGTTSQDGAGGAGFGAIGGIGGNNAGASPMNPSVDPLRGGCTGGTGFRSGAGADGGLGGGAIELIVLDTLLVIDGGVVSASGGGGGAAIVDLEGGGGGGSGGTVILEARTINLRNGAVTANGGGGGEGGADNGVTGSGLAGSLNTSTAAAGGDNGRNGGAGGNGGAGSNLAGSNGSNNTNHGGGGGGGAAGVVFVRAMSCIKGTGVISGAQPMSISCP